MRTKPNQPKTIIYMRVSSEMQDVEMQLKECKEYVTANLSDRPCKIFSDPVLTSKIKMNKRPGLMAMLGDVASNDTVLVYKLDRLSRDIVEMVTIYRMIRAKGCRLVSLHDSNCDDEFTIGILGVMAQKERSDISTRSKSAHKLKQSKSELCSRHVPYGYKIDPDDFIQTTKRGKTVRKLGKLVPCPTEQQVISAALEMFDQGYSYRLICQKLTEMGCLNRYSNPFQPMTLCRVLKRESQTRNQRLYQHCQ